MIEFLKTGEDVISINGYLAAVPDPVGIYLTGLDYQISAMPAGTLNFMGSADRVNNYFQFFAFNATNWGAWQSEIMVMPEGSFNYVGVYADGESYRAVSADFYELNSLIPVFTQFNFDIALTGSQVIDQVPTNYVSGSPVVTEDFGPASATALLTQYLGEQLVYMCLQVYNDDQFTGYGMMAVSEDDLTFTYYNTILQTAGEGGYWEPSATFLTDFEGVYMTYGKNAAYTDIERIAFSLNPYVDWHAGDYTSSVPEVVFFNDPQFLAAKDAFNYYVTPIVYPNPDSFFVVFDYGDDTIAVIRAYPATETFVVYRFERINADGARFLSYSDLANGLIRMEFDAVNNQFGFWGEGSLYYGVGIIGSMPAVNVPIYAPVSLPCFVNCVPLIDRRK